MSGGSYSGTSALARSQQGRGLEVTGNFSAEPALHGTVGSLLFRLSLAGLQRIDAGLEGAWSETASPIWHAGRRGARLRDVPKSHARYRPSLELVFRQHWVGLHCYRPLDDRYVFDEDLARAVVRYVDLVLGRA